jgi:hypothetical protein
MKRSTFIASLFAAPLLIKELIAAKPIDPRFVMGDYQPFKVHRREGLGLYEPVSNDSWIEFSVPMTRMNWEMQVTSDGNGFYKKFNFGKLPEFYNDHFRRTRKNGLIKLGKARR